MEKMCLLTVKQFTDNLASEMPTPGGGGAAALCGALSSALSSMVFSLTVGKKIYREYNDETKKLIDDGLAKSNEIKDRLLELIDDDAEVFEKVMAAYRLPKFTQEAISFRQEQLQKAYKEAMMVPYSIAEEAFKIFPLLKDAALYGNSNLISDAGVGAITALSCIESAMINVKINLSGITDEKLAEEMKSKCEKLQKDATDYKEEIMKLVNEKL